MRLLLVQTPAGSGRSVADLADERGAIHTSVVSGPESETVLVRVENQVAQHVIEALHDVDGTTVTFVPHEAMLLTDDDEADASRHEQETQPRPGVEVYLRGLRAVGSWSSFLGYAVVSGALGWVALWQSSVFILVAAVLVAPYPSPALNAALATAGGDARLLGRSVVRYAASLSVGITVAYLLSLVVGLELPTDLMRSTSFVSYTAALLPLTGGAAAALFLSQSEESSLISAAAAGVLVAVALVPPLGVVGMSAAIGDWDAVVRGGFLLLLQIVGINVAAPLVLWAYRTRPPTTLVRRHGWTTALVSLGASVVLLAGLLVWQVADPPSLGRPTIARDIQTTLVEELEDDPEVDYVGAEVRFAVARTGQDDLLIASVYVRPTGDAAPDAEQLRRRLQRLVESREHDVVPLVDVTVLPPPPV